MVLQNGKHRGYMQIKSYIEGCEYRLKFFAKIRSIRKVQGCTSEEWQRINGLIMNEFKLLEELTGSYYNKNRIVK